MISAFQTKFSPRSLVKSAAMRHLFDLILLLSLVVLLPALALIAREDDFSTIQNYVLLGI